MTSLMNYYLYFLADKKVIEICSEAKWWLNFTVSGSPFYITIKYWNDQTTQCFPLCTAINAHQFSPNMQTRNCHVYSKTKVCATCIGVYKKAIGFWRVFTFLVWTAIFLFCHRWQKWEAPFLFNFLVGNNQNVLRL